MISSSRGSSRPRDGTESPALALSRTIYSQHDKNRPGRCKLILCLEGRQSSQVAEWVEVGKGPLCVYEKKRKNKNADKPRIEDKWDCDLITVISLRES